MTKTGTLKYLLLPQVFPRFKNLIGTNFLSYLSFLIAYIFNAVRILPANHPALTQNTSERYTIRKVLAAAANNITFSKKNIDQIIIFFSILIGLVLFVLQFVILCLSVLVKVANAQPAAPSSYGDLFTTTTPSSDIAFRFLDLVFGVPGIFDSSEIANANAFHSGLQAMLELYSIGILIVSVIIIVYFVIAIVAETAQSGIPFGQRFSHSWAAVRLILFFGLIIPAASGLNGGQFVIMYAAKFGSGLATNGWIYFIDHAESGGETAAGERVDLISLPKADIHKISEIPAFMLIVKTCEWAYSRSSDKDITAYMLWGRDDGDNEAITSGGRTFQQYAIDSNGNDLTIVFGVQDRSSYPNAVGSIEPYCGSMTLPVSDVSEPGSAVIQTAYLDLIKNIWFGDFSSTGGMVTTLPQTIDVNARNYTFNFMDTYPAGGNYLLPAEDMTDYIVSEMTTLFLGDGTGTSGVVYDAIQAQIANDGYNLQDEVKELGWAGAGIWYNKIAQKNGALVSALMGIPRIKQYPKVMENVRQRKLDNNDNPTPEDQFTPSLGSTEAYEAELPDYMLAGTLNQPYLYWIEYQPEKDQSGNIIIDTINVVLGTQGLFDMCRNADIHPLAQLSGVGRSMLESSISAAGMTVLTTILGVTSSAVSSTTFAFAQFFGAVTSIGLLIGFILFYIVPFLPFLYFFFAVGGWIKGIFEAMVAVPLWALAHLRIDGDGIPGEAGLQGYFLLFEVFIRPILIIFGLVASITVFAAMVRVLNEVFELAVANLAGFDANTSSYCAGARGAGGSAPTGSADWARGPVDDFFFTILYAILVYMIGMASFKLIDQIPNTILTRWMGAETPSFNDSNEDAAGGLLTYVSLAGSQFGGEISGGLQGIGTSLQNRG